jgi:hypothetical protein
MDVFQCRGRLASPFTLQSAFLHFHSGGQEEVSYEFFG